VLPAAVTCTAVGMPCGKHVQFPIGGVMAPINQHAVCVEAVACVRLALVPRKQVGTPGCSGVFRHVPAFVPEQAADTMGCCAYRPLRKQIDKTLKPMAEFPKNAASESGSCGNMSAIQLPRTSSHGCCPHSARGWLQEVAGHVGGVRSAACRTYQQTRHTQKRSALLWDDDGPRCTCRSFG